MDSTSIVQTYYPTMGDVTRNSSIKGKKLNLKRNLQYAAYGTLLKFCSWELPAIKQIEISWYSSSTQSRLQIASTSLPSLFRLRIPGAGHPELVRLDGIDQSLAVFRFGGVEEWRTR